ncbi:MAG TPA: dethiobiotin synthase [Caulobacteraceae bacterium]|nr:dethiobiotin synthase [Caulobacteraceae bacterium]
MAAFFITGSGTDIGKTYLTAGLLAHWRGQGLSPWALKPVVSGFDEADPAGSDPAILLAALGRAVTPKALDALAPFRFRAPLSPDHAAALEGRDLTLAAAVEACRRAMDQAAGPVLIEGAGGVMSPLNAHETMLDLIVAVGAPVVFVAGDYLGAISHALTGLTALKARGAAIAAIVVNESGQGSVGLEQTAASLTRQWRSGSILTVPRSAGPWTWAQISTALSVCPPEGAERPA